MSPRLARLLWFGTGVAVSCSLSASLPAQRADSIVPIASLRVRHESWDWFDANAAGRYGFIGVHARVGAAQDGRRFGWRLEAAAPALLGLPQDAVQPGPAGQLGLGGTYAASNDLHRDAVGLWLKTASLRLGRDARDGSMLRLGRFEFSDGSEWTPRDPTLARVRQQRIAQRLIGPFGFTHGQRSFDGAQFQSNRESWGLTLAALRPTGGVFMVEGGRPLDVRVGYAALNATLMAAGRPTDLRVFAIQYDDRRNTVPVDSRPLVERQTASRAIEVSTLGAHVVQRWGSAEQPLDLLLWGARQFGRWSALQQSSGALAAEVGWRNLAHRAQPGVRVGVFNSTGDADPGDGTHGTFHQMLPTPRAYALFPFYNLQNVQEAFVSADMRLRRDLTLRASAHRLRLSEANDLWTLGGGAFNDDVFGFPGRSSGGARTLGSAASFSLLWQPSARVGIELFASQASGGDVMSASYGSVRPARLLYLETTVRR